MSSQPPSSTTLRHAIQMCRDFEGEAAYECITSVLGEGSQRTLKEVLIRSLAVHVISLAAYGQLMSLQGRVSTKRHPWTSLIMLATFFILPEVALAQLSWGVWRGLRGLLWSRTRRTSFWYYVAVSLGSYTSKGDDSVPLHTIEPANARYERRKYGAVWLGRLVLLLMALVQYLGSLGIRYRMYTVFSDYWSTFHVFDKRNFDLALGGLTVVINSTLHVLTNLTWHHIEATTPEDVHLSPTTASSQGIENQDILPSHRTPVAASEQTPRAPTPIRQKLQTYNNIFVTCLNKIFPVARQHAIEGAIVLHTIVASISWMIIRSDPYSRSLSFFIEAKIPGRTRPISRPRWGIDSLGLWVLVSDNLDQYVQPYVSCMLILVSCWIRLVSRNDWLGGYIPRRIRTFLKFCDKWITGGRGIVSFFGFFIPIVWLAIYVDFVGLGYNIWWETRTSEQWANKSKWDRLLAETSRYKDPWYDNMYIL